MDYLFVKSRYAAPWVGVVLDSLPRRGQHDLYLILVVKDGSGKTPRKRILKVLDASWTSVTQKIDLSNINPDWFKNFEHHNF